MVTLLCMVLILVRTVIYGFKKKFTIDVNIHGNLPKIPNEYQNNT